MLRTSILLIVAIVISAGIPTVVEYAVVPQGTDNTSMARSVRMPVSSNATIIDPAVATVNTANLAVDAPTVVTDSLTVLLYLDDPFAAHSTNAQDLQVQSQEWSLVSDTQTLLIDQQCRHAETIHLLLDVEDETLADLANASEPALLEMQLQLPTYLSATEQLLPFAADPLWLVAEFKQGEQDAGTTLLDDEPTSEREHSLTKRRCQKRDASETNAAETAPQG
jgi:hypothetical protein